MADIWEEVEKAESPVIPDMVEVATANVWSDLQGDGILEGNKKTIKLGGASPLDLDSEDKAFLTRRKSWRGSSFEIKTVPGTNTKR